jgi:hypothetical protein
MTRFFAGGAHESDPSDSRISQLTRRASAAALCTAGVILCLPPIQYDMSMQRPPIGYDVSRPAALGVAALAGLLYMTSRIFEHRASKQELPEHTDALHDDTEITWAPPQFPEDSAQK